MMKNNTKRCFTMLALCMLAWNAMAQTTQVKGLTVIVEFLQVPFTNPVDSVAMMMNNTGFQGWGNTGSVKDFYYNQTNGKYLITSEVVKVSLPYYVSDYRGPSATRQDISDIVTAINQQYPAGFQNLTIDPADGKLMVFTVLTKAGGGAWAFGQQSGNTIIKNNGVDLQIGDGNITNYGLNENPNRNTICHELGHSVFGWRDFYSKTEINGHSNLGHYCVMGSGGTQFNASPISAPLRYKKGWITTVTELPNTTTTYTVTSNSRSKVFKYTNPANPFEYYLIEALYVNGDYPAIDGENFTMDQGLAVWYVDEERAGFNPGAVNNDPKVKLLQADGLDEMHDLSINEDIWSEKANIRGDINDLFDNQFSTLSAATHPLFRWKDGGETGLTITNISAPGATMQFTVQARPNTITSQATYSNGGTISPRGVISYTSSSPKTFTIVPEMGYVVANVVVDGVSLGAVTSHTINTAGNHTISATFQKSTTADPVPSPWQEIEIGNTRQAGTAGARSGVFGLESNHYDIWGTEDGLSFIYQPLTGNGEIVAKVASMNFPGEWSKAGIMMRESLTANSKHFMLVKTPANNLAPQYRDITGGDSYHNPQGTEIKDHYSKYPYLKIVRLNNVFTSYCSLDGISNWVQLATYTIPMNTTIYVGMCASAGSDVLATKVTFSNVSVVQNTTPTTYFCFEAESGLGQSAFAPFQVVNDANASGGKYIVVPNGTGNQTGTPTNSIATFSFNVPTTATYHFWVRILAQTSNDNSMFIRTDNDSYGSPWTPGTYTSWTWKKWTSKSVSAGNHTITIARNEDGLQIDKVLVTKSSSTPTGTGCGSAREEEELVEFETGANAVSSFPNPFSTETTISLPEGETATIQVFNASGILVHESGETSNYRFGNGLDSGIYFVKINREGKIETLKLVKE